MSSTAPKHDRKCGDSRFLWRTWRAVALTEFAAGFVSFQRWSSLIPPTQNNRSAVSPLLLADNSAGFVQLQTTTTTFQTFGAAHLYP